jgi:hypothetical protein
MMFALESTKWLHTDFEEGAVNVVESKQPNEGAEGWSIDRKRPIGNQIKLGFSRAVASGCDVVTDMFDAVGKELAFLQLESDTVFHKNSTNTLKQSKKSGNNSRPQKNVVDDDSTSKMRGVRWVARSKKSFPFGAEDAHHTSIKSWSVARPERHYRPTVFVIVRGEKRQLFLVFPSNLNLVVTGHVV